MDKFLEYFKGVKAEWGKITWPDRKQVIVQTIVVLVVTAAFTIIIYGFDIVFQFLIDLFCRLMKYIGLLK